MKDIELHKCADEQNVAKQSHFVRQTTPQTTSSASPSQEQRTNTSHEQC
jgi:hypothetical protein